MFWNYYFVYGLFRLLAFYNGLVEIAVLFTTECSRAGIQPLFLRGLLEELHSFPHLGFQAKLQLLHRYNFYRIMCCVLGCCSGGFRNPLSELVSHWRKDSFTWEISLESSWTHFRSLVPGQLFPIIYSVVPAGNCVILEGSFNEGSCGSFRVFSYDWRVQTFIRGGLWWDIH